MNKMIRKIAERAKKASREMALVSDSIKKLALEFAASALVEHESEIIQANGKDLKAAKKKNLSSALVDRLTLNSKRIGDMAKALREIAVLPDPVGKVVSEWKNDSGMTIQKVRVPLGVIAMVYESRPNVTVEAAALCLKAGNSVILRGGSEAIHSNSALSRVMIRAIVEKGIPEDAVSFIEDTDRKNIYALGLMDDAIDLLIARGSETMVREIRKKAAVPVLGHGKGVCHVYVDKDADLKMAEEIAFNSKVQRPGVCNAMETLLVHKDVARDFLPRIGKRYFDAHVMIKGDPQTKKILPDVQRASEKDWSEEYLDLIVSIRVVASLHSAIEHVNRYGSGHTDAIVTENQDRANRFLKEADSAAVFHNVSTRMHDGGVFGLGAEIGISTQKLHARGTMGVQELTTTKYAAHGSGQIRK